MLFSCCGESPAKAGAEITAISAAASIPKRMLFSHWYDYESDAVGLRRAGQAPWVDKLA